MGVAQTTTLKGFSINPYSFQDYVEVESLTLEV